MSFFIQSRLYQKRGTNKVFLSYFPTSENYLISFARQLLHHYVCISPQYYTLHRQNYHMPELLRQIRSKCSCTDEQNLDKYLLLDSQYLGTAPYRTSCKETTKSIYLVISMVSISENPFLHVVLKSKLLYHFRLTLIQGTNL